MQTEILIVRNDRVPRLYNVVGVDFEKQDAYVIEPMLTFEQASELKEKLDGLVETEAEIA